MNKLLLCFLAATLTHALTPIDYQSLNMVEDTYKEGRSANCIVGFVCDVKGNNYVVKQYKHGAYSRAAAIPIGELVTLDMGHAVGVPQNKACLIPARVPFIGKSLNMPATVHEHAPGVQFDRYAGQTYKGMSICQHASTGLTLEIIHHMSCHSDLPRLVALDTYVGNIDRSVYNYFYDESTDSFMGIDMGGAFSANICKVSLENLQAVSTDQLSDAARAGLHIYYQTFKQLVALYPPEQVSAKINEYAQTTGLFNEMFFSKMIQRKWIKYLDRSKSAIKESYSYALELLVELERLLGIDQQEVFIEDHALELVVDQELDYQALAGTLIQYKKSKYMNSVVVYFQGPHKTNYVVKQFKNPGLSILLATTASELVALDMGVHAGVRVDRACLIPAGVPFEGKSLNMPAAVHAHAPGVRFDKYVGDYYKGLSICQKDNQGLTREIIYHMSRHKDLPAIIALDTYVGNNDRNSRNYFYDEVTDSFTGIDMGAAFRRDLCKVSAENIAHIMQDPSSNLTEAEWEGLFIYKETLKLLANLYPPDRICDQLDECADVAGLGDAQFFSDKDRKRWAKYLAISKHSIRKSAVEAINLIDVLERLFT